MTDRIEELIKKKMDENIIKISDIRIEIYDIQLGISKKPEELYKLRKRWDKLRATNGKFMNILIRRIKGRDQLNQNKTV